MKLNLSAAAAIAAIFVLVHTARAAEPESIYETIAARDGHTVIAVAIKEAGEIAALKAATGNWTLFAPPDASFKKLDDDTIGDIATKKEVVQRLLRSHLVMGTYTAEELKKWNGKELKTVSGFMLKVEDRKDGLFVGGVKVVTTDIVCKNGVIHIIDAVLPVLK